MSLQIGDLVKISPAYVSLEESCLIDWIGIIISYRGQGLGDEPEWFVQWAHQQQKAVEYGYYLEKL